MLLKPPIYSCPLALQRRELRTSGIQQHSTAVSPASFPQCGDVRGFNIVNLPLDGVFPGLGKCRMPARKAPIRRAEMHDKALSMGAFHGLWHRLGEKVCLVA